MKASVLALFVCLAAWAQTAPPSPAPKPAAPSAAAPAPSLPDLPDETVVAIFDDGTKLTMGEFKQIFAVLPAANQQMALRDKANFLHQWALMRKLKIMAEADKLDQQSPTRDALEYSRMMILSQAKINEAVNAIQLEPDAVERYYQANKDKYKQVKVKAIYISFSTALASQASKGKPTLTEEQAKAKAEKLVAQIRAGADFVKLVKENSDDETSRAKDGDFANLRLADNVPDAIRSVVFSLKQGETGDPVKQPNGFYILKAEEITYRPLSQVQDEIFSQLRQDRFSEWMRQTDRDTKVQYPTPAFLGAVPAPIK
jgi:parvulin-like peptidyl-prolyl isomerase